MAKNISAVLTDLAVETVLKLATSVCPAGRRLVIWPNGHLHSPGR